MTTSLLAVLCLLPSLASAALPPLSAAREREVERLLKAMTLEEKAGQMTQLSLSFYIKKGTFADPVEALDWAKIEDSIVKHHTGSILNVAENKAYTVEQWRRIIARVQDIAARTRLKVPVLYGIDSIHGATYVRDAVLFPQALSMGASRDESLARRAGEVTAYETRAAGIPWNFFPVLDVGRHPAWPRFWETFGEEPYLVSRLGAAYVEGLQGADPASPDRVAACMKHYVGYSASGTGKDRTPAILDERTLREVYLPPFADAVKAGALTVMVNSAEISGTPGHANRRLLTEILKDELGFEGLVVSDWEDVKRLYERDRVAETPEEAVRLAVWAGVDMSMVPENLDFAPRVVANVRAGKLPQSRVDDAVRRILRVKARLGLFEASLPPAPGAVGAAAAWDDSLLAARRSLVLLKNDGGLLPFKTGTRILVGGELARLRQVLNGAWTLGWQSDDETQYPSSWPTLYDALAARFGAKNVSFVSGKDFSASADAVVLVLGEKAYTETPGNIDDLTLPADQLALAEAAAKSGKPVVILLAEGRPRIVTPAAEKAKAVVFLGLPGPKGAQAAAELLHGDYSPSGRLPFSYPRAPNDLVLYDHKPLEAQGGNVYKPLWPFGHGLSYARFRYSGLTLEPGAGKGGKAAVIATVTNEGPAASEHVAEVYVTDLYGSFSRPVRQLRGWKRVDLEPGASAAVRFELGFDELSMVGADGKRFVEPGEFEVDVASMTARFRVP